MSTKPMDPVWVRQGSTWVSVPNTYGADHGKPGTYAHRRCRCERCTAEVVAYWREHRRTKRKALVAALKPLEGTPYRVDDRGTLYKSTAAGRWHKVQLTRWAKLTEDDVRAIRGMLADGVSGAQIAERYKVSSNTISAIHTGKNWSWVK